MQKIFIDSMNFWDFIYHDVRLHAFNGRFHCWYKVLDASVKPDSWKIKVIPSVAKYVSALTEST